MNVALSSVAEFGITSIAPGGRGVARSEGVAVSRTRATQVVCFHRMIGFLWRSLETGRLGHLTPPRQIGQVLSRNYPARFARPAALVQGASSSVPLPGSTGNRPGG